MISFLEVCALPPIRQKKANGWGTELIQIHTVRDLGPRPHDSVMAPQMIAGEDAHTTAGLETGATSADIP